MPTIHISRINAYRNTYQPIILYLCAETRFYMRKRLIPTICLLMALLSVQLVSAQCSICTKTASQLGNGPASALNAAILYLAAAPFAIMGFIGWRWWKNEQGLIDGENRPD